MQESFHSGGWGMYPTTLFGLILLAAAVLYAVRPGRRNLRVVRNLMFLTFLSGVLGTVTGVIKTFISSADLPAADLGRIVVIGTGESLHNLGLALCLMIMTTILTTIGAVRSPNQDKAELVDPRG